MYIDSLHSLTPAGHLNVAVKATAPITITRYWYLYNVTYLKTY